MAINIYDTVNQLAKELPQTEQYGNVKLAFAALKNDLMAYNTYKKFMDLQAKMRTNQMTGQQPNEDDLKQLENLAKQMQDMKPVQSLMEAEQALNQLLNDINSSLMKPIENIYKDLGPSQPQQPNQSK
ncbi:YlbF family regulator [Ligilactobacillus sp. LYQ60]|uniref:YlbF family regulator n=1 Tax=unclassified Ligilactobacillus TaxID=2767920 RepID=UPI00385379A0